MENWSSDFLYAVNYGQTWFSGFLGQCYNGSNYIRGITYRITPKQIDRLWFFQSGLCGCCRNKLRRYHVDHDHLTTKVRGLLCHKCNVGLGRSKDKSRFTGYLANPPARKLFT